MITFLRCPAVTLKGSVSSRVAPARTPLCGISCPASQHKRCGLRFLIVRAFAGFSDKKNLRPSKIWHASTVYARFISPWRSRVPRETSLCRVHATLSSKSPQTRISESQRRVVVLLTHVSFIFKGLCYYEKQHRVSGWHATFPSKSLMVRTLESQHRETMLHSCVSFLFEVPYLGNNTPFCNPVEASRPGVFSILSRSRDPGEGPCRACLCRSRRGLATREMASVPNVRRFAIPSRSRDPGEGPCRACLCRSRRGLATRERALVPNVRRFAIPSSSRDPGEDPRAALVKASGVCRTGESA
ncbi:hypothetical protein K438DRAFT_526539 [Mycena galopus ATCC 62051]|nr:hypothetical protein K438DRAFT_526539 [Mycena galopus ATCC 62051]